MTRNDLTRARERVDTPLTRLSEVSSRAILVYLIAALVGGCASTPERSPDDRKRVRELAEAVRTGDAREAENAAVSLSRLRPPAREAVPAVLRRMLREQDDSRAAI